MITNSGYAPNNWESHYNQVSDKITLEKQEHGENSK